MRKRTNTSFSVTLPVESFRGLFAYKMKWMKLLRLQTNASWKEIKERKAALEETYESAILHLNHRRLLLFTVQTWQWPPHISPDNYHYTEGLRRKKESAALYVASHDQFNSKRNTYFTDKFVSLRPTKLEEQIESQLFRWRASFSICRLPITIFGVTDAIIHGSVKF